MAERIPNDICEEILVRLDVENLVRCKSVCKSWKSLISCPRFVKAHRKRSYNCNDNEVVFPYYFPMCKDDLKYYFVGSANGLVCINSFSGDEFIIANPWTREERIFKMPDHAMEFSRWGFGYDSLTDDYKVVLGNMDYETGGTSFQVFSLKSNVWKHIGDVNYRCAISTRCLGTLCNEALHWVMYSKRCLSMKIISLDLSKEVFKEIPQPDDDARYEPRHAFTFNAIVATKDECLCIYRESLPEHNVWLMKNYNVKQSWVALGNYQLKFEYDYNDHAVRYEKSTDYNTWFSQKCASVPTTNVMQSLVSPNLQACNESAGSF